jgi:hypothetical protein
MTDPKVSAQLEEAFVRCRNPIRKPKKRSVR